MTSNTPKEVVIDGVTHVIIPESSLTFDEQQEALEAQGRRFLRNSLDMRKRKFKEEPTGFPPGELPEEVKFRFKQQQLRLTPGTLSEVARHYHLSISGPTGKTAYFTFVSQDEVLRKYGELLTLVKDMMPDDVVTRERIGTTIFSSGTIIMWYNCIFDEYCLDKPKAEGEVNEC